MVRALFPCYYNVRLFLSPASPERQTSRRRFVRKYEKKEVGRRASTAVFRREPLRATVLE